MSSNTLSGGEMVTSGGVYSSNPAPGGTLEFGTASFTAGPPPKSDWPAPEDLLIINTGAGPLEIDSIEIDEVPFRIRSVTDPNGTPVTKYPEFIPPGAQVAVHILFAPVSAGSFNGHLKITTGDPANPVVKYLLTGDGVQSVSLEDEIATVLFILASAHSEHQATPYSQIHAATAGSQTGTLTFDSSQGQSVIADIPSYLGGGSITLHDFTGSVTVTALPIPGDSGHMALRIESGTMTAPSFKTPTGQDTGVNTLTFGSPDASGGTLQLSDGSYTAFAQATITNDLIPAGVIVKGTYSGTYNSQTGKVTSNSKSTDILTANARPLNISTRLAVGTGDNVLIGGFIVTGTTNKKVIVRAIGPSLGAAGVKGALADPVLELHDGTSAIIATNNDWQTTQIGGVITADQVGAINASGVAPTDSHESAIVATLAPGKYTAVIRGADGATGVGLAEVFDLDKTATSKLANISTRGFVQTGSNVMIGGFIVGAGPADTVLVRAIGRSLTAAGVQGALADPMLELHDSTGALIASNDNWQTTQTGGVITADQVTAITATGVPPSDRNESAIVATLPPGNYTAVVRGAGSSTGVALVEVYNLN
jgi:hypothetical protein